MHDGRRLIAVAAMLGALLSGTGSAVWAQGGSGALGASARRVIEIAPPPAFVVEHAPVTPADAAYPPTQGVRMLLLEVQHDATAAEPAVYSRQVREAAAYAGVAQVSQLVVPFDPAFQRFEINHIRVVRNGVEEDRRDRAHLDYLRREQGLEMQMVTGALTASLRLDDVRVGDIVDIAYTIYGGQRAFEGRDARTFMLAVFAPVERFAVRSQWSGDVRWKARGEGPPVRVARERGRTLLEVEPQALEALEIEEFTPAWEPMIPLLVAANFGDWDDVADWGRALYETAPDPAVTALAESIAAEHPGKAEQVVAALRFVQQEVRYFALVLGEGGYVPAAPGETLRTRVGDCKAKTLLFLALMDELGIEAEPVLVNTVVGRVLPDFPPSPMSFDHVIARVALDGERYWLDPTNPFQGGALDRLAQPDYGFALPMARRSRGLVEMGREASGEPSTVLRETYDLSRSPSEPATLARESIHTGADADYWRAFLAFIDPSELDEAIRTGYEAAYGRTSILAAGRIDDDIDANRLVLSIELELADPFTARPEEMRRYFDFRADGIVGPVAPVGDEERAWPVGLLHQQHLRHEITLLLPDLPDWSLEEEADAIENDAFRFERTVTPGPQSLTFVAELEPLAEAIPPDAIARVRDDQSRMLELLAYQVWTPLSARAQLPDLALPEIEIDLAPEQP